MPAALIFANVRGLSLRDVRVIWDTTAAPQDRHAIYAARVEGFSVDGFEGAPNGTKLAAIGLEKASRVFITGSRPRPGTAVFVSHTGVLEQEIVLAGNDLQKETVPVKVGAVHKHLP